MQDLFDDVDLHDVLNTVQPLRPPSSPWASDVVTLGVQDLHFTRAPRRDVKRKKIPLPMELQSIEELRYESLQADPHAPPEVNNFFETSTMHADVGSIADFLDSYWTDDIPQSSPAQQGRAGEKSRARQLSAETREWT